MSSAFIEGIPLRAGKGLQMPNTEQQLFKMLEKFKVGGASREEAEALVTDFVARRESQLESEKSFNGVVKRVISPSASLAGIARGIAGIGNSVQEMIAPNSEPIFEIHITKYDIKEKLDEGVMAPFKQLKRLISGT